MISVDFSGCENERFKLIKIKKDTFFRFDHNDTFDHKYHIDPGIYLAFNITLEY